MQAVSPARKSSGPSIAFNRSESQLGRASRKCSVECIVGQLPERSGATMSQTVPGRQVAASHTSPLGQSTSAMQPVPGVHAPSTHASPLAQSDVCTQWHVPIVQVKPGAQTLGSVQGTGIRGSGVQRPPMQIWCIGQLSSNSQSCPPGDGWTQTFIRHSPGAGHGSQCVPSPGGGGFGSGTQRGMCVVGSTAHTYVSIEHGCVPSLVHGTGIGPASPIRLPVSAYPPS